MAKTLSDSAFLASCPWANASQSACFATPTFASLGLHRVKLVMLGIALWKQPKRPYPTLMARHCGATGSPQACTRLYQLLTHTMFALRDYLRRPGESF